MLINLVLKLRVCVCIYIYIYIYIPDLECVKCQISTIIGRIEVRQT
jgi:hypothetical protein